MSELPSLINSKFSEAERLFLEGKNPFRVEDGSFDTRYEIIGLDCEDGAIDGHRYLIARCSLDTHPLGIGKNVFGNSEELDVTNVIVKFPRMAGDHRRLEDLTAASRAGQFLAVDAIRDLVFVLSGEEPHFYSDVAIDAMSEQIAQLRLAERLQ